jgi:hypothetical protein
MQYSLTLTANVPTRQQTSGSFFLLTDIGAATSIDVQFHVHAQTPEHITTAKRGLKASLPHGQKFNSIEFLSTVNTTIQVVISDGLVDISQLDGANVSVINNGTAINVSNDRGTPALPIYVNGTIAGNPTAVAIVDDAPVTASSVVGAIVAALATRVSLRLTNTGANPVAIGSATLTWAKAAVIIQPGDTWVEERGANLAWYCITQAAGSTLGVQEITA